MLCFYISRLIVANIELGLWDEMAKKEYDLSAVLGSGEALHKDFLHEN